MSAIAMANTSEGGLDMDPVILTWDPQNEEECLERHSNVTHEAGDFCPPAWDHFYCWPHTSSASQIFVPCEHIFQFLKGLDESGEAHAFRECSENGTWTLGNWTNYTACLNLMPQKEEQISPFTVSYIMFTGSLASLLSLGITLFIFSYFKALQCSRIRVHRNLVLSLILHSVMMVVIALPGMFEEIVDPFRDSSWLCKTVLAVKMYSAMTCIHWMFVEGLLLHSSITVSVFQQEPPFKVYYAVGWGIPLVCVTVWVILMSLTSSSLCWGGYGLSPFVWLITGPMILALVVNSFFLINIIRILVTKLRMSVSIETKQVKKAIKATALLFPLLGITHLLFCINPGDDAHLEHAYMITNAILQSSQGIFVAILYCFLNSEVQSVLMNAYLRSSLRRHPGGPSARSSRLGSGRPSATTSTNVSQSDTNGNRAKIGSSYKPTSALVPLVPLVEDSECAGSTENAQQILLEKETSFIH